MLILIYLIIRSILYVFIFYLILKNKIDTFILKTRYTDNLL